MKLNPILDRIVIKPTEVANKTTGGIFIPDNAKDSPTKGTVLGVGTGRVNKDGTVVPMVVKEGDTVLYTKNSGIEVKVDGEEHRILTQDEILAVVTE